MHAELAQQADLAATQWDHANSSDAQRADIRCRIGIDAVTVVRIAIESAEIGNEAFDREVRINTIAGKKFQPARRFLFGIATQRVAIGAGAVIYGIPVADRVFGHRRDHR